MNVFVASDLPGFGQRTCDAVAHEGKDRADCFLGWHMICVRKDKTRDAAQWALSTPRSERVFVGAPADNDSTDAGQVCVKFLVVCCRVVCDVACGPRLA